MQSRINLKSSENKSKVTESKNGNIKTLNPNNLFSSLKNYRIINSVVGQLRQGGAQNFRENKTRSNTQITISNGIRPS